MIFTIKEFKAYMDKHGLVEGKSLIVDGAEIVDADGNPVNAEVVEIMTSSTATEAVDEVVEDEAPKEDVKSIVKQVVEAMEVKSAKTVNINGKDFTQKSTPAMAWHNNSKVFLGKDGNEKSYAFGNVIRASMGNKKSQDWLDNSRFSTKVQNETTASAGGHSVPTILSSDLIRFVEEYGVCRRNIDVVQMTSDTLNLPTLVSEAAATWMIESAALTEADAVYGVVNLVAQKLGMIQKITSELNDDSLLNMGARAAEHFAQAFAFAEDDACFNGDGTSGDGNIDGLIPLLRDTNHDASLVSAAAGNTSFGQLDVDDFSSVVGKLPAYVRNPKWYISKAGYEASMGRLLYALPGTGLGEAQQGINKTFMGYPVEFTEVMNKTLTAQIDTGLVLFGALNESSVLGDRKQITVESSDQVYWANDQLAVRAIERVDIKQKNIGTDTVTGSMILLDTPGA